VRLEDAASRFQLSLSYLRKVKYDYEKTCKEGRTPFFEDKKRGPKTSHRADSIRDTVLDLRKKEFSIVDIKSYLDGLGKKTALDTINNILKKEGFTRLPRRTYNQKNSISSFNKLPALRSSKLDLANDEFSTN